MPKSKIIFFKDDKNRVPVWDWINHLHDNDSNAYATFILRFGLLAERGFELRRPYADYVDKGLYELRITKRTAQYRILYFFHGKNVIVLAHAFSKTKRIPKRDLEIAVKRKELYETDPENHGVQRQL